MGKGIAELVDVELLNRIVNEASTWVLDRDQNKWPPVVWEASDQIFTIFGLISGLVERSETLIDLGWWPCFHGIWASGKGKRTGAEYEVFLTSTEGLTLGTRFCHPKLLNRVTDTFWGHLST